MKRVLLIAILLACLTPVLMAADDSDKAKADATLVSNSLRDMKATVVVVSSNKDELQKIGKAFAENYEFKKASVQYKYPDKLKMNGALGIIKAEFVTSGAFRLIRIPSLRFKKREDISDQPEKRVTALDVGIVTSSVWDIYQVSWVKTEKSESGANVYVLQLRTPKSKKSQMIWVEAKTCKLLRRDRLADDGSLKSKTLYSGHVLKDGVWVPVKAEVYNAEDKLAAVAETRDIIMNDGINDKEFE